MPNDAGRRASAAAALGLAAVMSLTACLTPAGSDAEAPEQEDAHLVLIGAPSFSFEDFGLELEDLGYTVSDEPAVSPETDLLLVVVNAQDGPMPQTLAAVEGLVGSVVPRVAIALIDVDKQTDPELEALVVRETSELLTRYGITPVDTASIVRSPGADVDEVITVHLRRAPRDYRPTLPSAAPAPGPASVDNFAGVPMTDALELLAAQGLTGEVMADPDFGVVSDCDLLVMGQSPAPGTVLPAGGVVGLLVSPPDAVDPAMAGCLLPARTRGEIDARVAELAAQPSG